KIWPRVFFPFSLIRLEGVCAARPVSNAVNTSGEQRFPVALGKWAAAHLLVIRNISANFIRSRGAPDGLQRPVRCETMSRDTHQLSLWTERQGIPVISGNDSSILKTQVLHSPVRMSEHRFAFMSFSSTSSLYECINPLRAFRGLFKVEQLAVRLGVKRFTSLKVLQARNFTWERSEKLDQLCEPCSD